MTPFFSNPLSKTALLQSPNTHFPNKSVFSFGMSSPHSLSVLPLFSSSDAYQNALQSSP